MLEADLLHQILVPVPMSSMRRGLSRGARCSSPPQGATIIVCFMSLRSLFIALAGSMILSWKSRTCSRSSFYLLCQHVSCTTIQVAGTALWHCATFREDIYATAYCTILAESDCTVSHSQKHNPSRSKTQTSWRYCSPHPNIRGCLHPHRRRYQHRSSSQLDEWPLLLLPPWKALILHHSIKLSFFWLSKEATKWSRKSRHPELLRGATSSLFSLANMTGCKGEEGELESLTCFILCSPIMLACYCILSSLCHRIADPNQPKGGTKEMPRACRFPWSPLGNILMYVGHLGPWATNDNNFASSASLLCDL